jgi:hypothetical protein
MTENQKASLPHFFLSVFEIQAAQISSLLADRSNCRRSGGRSTVWSRDLSSSLECLLPLSLSLSLTHTHTHKEQHQHSLSRSSVSVGGCARMKDMDDNDKKTWMII